jgi:PAS domain S-box-containing protein
MPESGNTYESVLKSAARSSTKVYTFARILPTFAFFAVMLIISFFLWKQSKDQIHTDLRSEFDKAATSVMTRLATKEEQKKQVINSMSGLYDILVEVVKDYFELYGSVPTNTYESIISISYAPRIQKKDLDMFVYNTRSMGYYNFELKSSGVRDIYYPIEYLVPFEGNENRIGYDIGDIYDTYEILEEARLEGQIVSTPFFEIRPGIEGFMLLSPIYKYKSNNDSREKRKDNFKGFVVLELNSQLFFKNALGHSIVNRNSSFPSDTSIIFEIVDKADGNPMQVYSSSNFSKLGTGYRPYLKSSQPFMIADRELMVNFYSVPNFGGDFRSRLPLLILIGSIIASIALTLFVFSILTGRARALDLANRMTASQRRIMDSSKDIISVLDTNGIWKSMNPASELILNYKPEELVGSDIKNYYFDEYEQFKFESLFNLDTDENTEKLDLKMKNKYGNMVWVNWIFTSSKSDKLVYAIGRDVTYEKIAEQQALLKTKQIQLAELFSREANESKTFFIRRFSHQLRNSLTSIIGYIQLILQNVFDSPEEERLYLKSSLESAEEIFSFVTSSDDYLKSQYRMSPIKFEFIKNG